MRKKYRVSANQSSTKITSNNTLGKDDISDSDKNNSINAIKEQVATTKENSTSVKSNNQRSVKSKNQISKAKQEKIVTYRNHRRLSLCETCPNTDFFLVRIFPHSD